MPVVAVSTCPTAAVPVTVGGAVFTGAVGEALSTAAVCVERETAEPAAFVAVTTCRIVAPRSAEASVYVAAVAPAISVQEPATQRSQPRAYVIGVEPVQVPAVALRVWPRVGVPEIVGGAVFEGGVAAVVGAAGDGRTRRGARDRGAGCVRRGDDVADVSHRRRP